MKYIFLSFIILSCSGGDKFNEITSANKYWVNIDYLRCIENNSPCYCESYIDKSVLILDSLNVMEIYGIGVESKSYKIYNTQNRHFIVDNNDTIYFHFDKTNMLKMNGKSYISSNKWNNVGERFIDKINGDFFKKKYKNEIKNFKKDKLFISCNKYYNMHFLSLGTNCKDTYILEYDNDSIFIYDFINKCEGKKINFKFQKKLILKFKQ